jgi:hypothetical protein
MVWVRGVAVSFWVKGGEMSSGRGLGEKEESWERVGGLQQG